MRYNQIRKIDISDGPGIRVALYTQGCLMHCPGCYNQESWDYNGGLAWDDKTKEHFLSLCNKPHIAGISLLGGEPLSSQNYDALIDLFTDFKTAFPDKTIWVWTGFTYENLNLDQLKVIEKANVLIDGPWISSLGDFHLMYRGSANQRVIDLDETRKEGELRLYTGGLYGSQGLQKK